MAVAVRTPKECMRRGVSSSKNVKTSKTVDCKKIAADCKKIAADCKKIAANCKKIAANCKKIAAKFQK
jgi:hypothetical protein